ncbi:MAG: M42 family peptidase, partial [Nanoarchaeota archaeon]
MVKKDGILMKLLNEAGPSGFEQPIRHFITKEIKPYVDEMRIDKFGNLIAHKKGSKPTVLLVAHMDEIGLLIKNISEEGHIAAAAVGGIEPAVLLGERVKIQVKGGKHIHGVVTTKEIHNGDEISAIPNMKDIYVDTGLSQAELEKLGVEIGSYLFITSSSIHLGNENFICGKALDDRLGCYVLIELAKRLEKDSCDIYFVFTVQEEVGLFGSKTSVYSIDPDWALVIDTTAADDNVADHCTKHIGKGPCITIKDSDMIGNKCINDLFRACAKKAKIPIQLEI